MGPQPASIAGTGETPAVARLARLDGLRGIAACVVAAYHVQLLYPGGLEPAYGGIAGWLFTWGWTFVDLFFVLSGFIFAHVYLGSGALKTGRQLGDFAAARIARLYPLHLAMLMIVLALEWSRPENTVQAFLAHLFMLQGFVPGGSDAFVGVSWSVSIELLCYALFALAAVSGGKTLARVSIALVSLAVVQLVLKGLPGGPWSSDELIRGIFGFFTGQLLWRYRGALGRLPVAVLVLAFAVGVTIDVGHFSPLLPLGLLAWPAALLVALRLRIFEAAPLLWVGDRSYAIYLIHGPVLNIAASTLGPLRPDPMGVVVVYAVFAVAVFALSDLALRTVERPGRSAVRRAWANRRAARAPSPLPIRAELD